MKSENYRQLLNNEFEAKEMTKEDFDNTLMHFAMLYHKEQLKLYDVSCSTESKPERFTNPKKLNKNLEALPIAIYDGEKYRYFIETNQKILTGSCQCFKNCDCANQRGEILTENKIWYRHISFDGTDKCFYSRPYYRSSIAI